MPRQRKIFAAVHSLRPGCSRALFAGRVIFRMEAVTSDGAGLMRRRRRRCARASSASIAANSVSMARRQRTERLIEVDCLGQLLADEIIVPCEFAVTCKRLLDAIGVAAAQRPWRVPRQQSLELTALCYLQRRRDWTRKRAYKHRSRALARSGSTASPCRDRVLHVAAFGYTLLEIVPLSLSRGNPATRWLRGVRLDRQCTTRLGELCADWACPV